MRILDEIVVMVGNSHPAYQILREHSSRIGGFTYQPPEIRDVGDIGHVLQLQDFTQMENDETMESEMMKMILVDG